MAEKFAAISNSSKDSPKAKTFENGWIVCRSQKRPGLLYDFNTVTGEALWRDPDKTAHNIAIMDKNKVPFDCHEPTEPPMYPKPPNTQKVSQKSSIPNVYNKQIINNQFPGKQFAIAPFVNPVCAPFGLIDSNNSISMSTVNGTPVWVAAPSASQVLLPTVTGLNQVQTIYSNLDNIHLQNSSMTLSNRFHYLNEWKPNTGNPIPTLREESSDQSYNHQQPCRNYKQWHEQPNQRPVNNNFKRHTDLRSKLSSRRRQDLNAKVADTSETNKKDLTVPVLVTEGELNPDDNDEWLEAHTDGEGRELNIDIECFWDLVDSSASRDCCYVIPTTRVLLNNMRFLTSLVISDDRLRLLTPRDVIRELRSAAFSSNGRLADYASRARTFAIRQMKNFPDNLKDAPNIKACLELIAPNIHVIRLVDDQDVLNKESINDGTITIAELKRFLTPKAEPKDVNNMQNICENIKIIVTNDEVQPENLPRVAKPLIQSQESPSKTNTSTNARTPEIRKVDTEKRTANACVQTDFDFIIALSSETNCNRKKTTESVNAAENTSDKQTKCNFTLADSKKPKEITLSSMANSAEAINNVVATAAPRKIRLKRLQPPNTDSNPEEKKPFKWRRRKSTRQASEVEEGNKNGPLNNTPSSIHIEQNDSSIDCKISDVSASAKMVDESSTSGVLSNSVDSTDFFKINRHAIRNETKTDRTVVYEVTSDVMRDRLNLRCDEWKSRFVQIMEEVLPQVLLLDPPFMDVTLRPPWTFYEATVCVKRKFSNERAIVEAANKLAVFLLKISDDRGNIEAHISPTDFMQMYTYSLNLVKKLQFVLNDLEDLQIASENLSKLLSDIREPNLDESYDDESFNYDEPGNNSPNISEAVTDMSTIISGVPALSTPVNNVSPKTKEKPRSCNNSPARYSLRSSRSNSEQKTKKVAGGQTDGECSENKEYTLFSSLGLQKRDVKVDCLIARTIKNSKDHPPLESPTLRTASVSPKYIDAKAEQKIIRNFRVCPDFEKRLNNCSNTEVNHEAVNEYFTDTATDDAAEVHFVADNMMQNDDVTETDDFAEDEFTNYDTYDYGNEYRGMTQMTHMDVDTSYDNTQSVVLDANSKLQKIVKGITCKYRRWLTDLRQFCELTNATIKNPNYHPHENEYQTNVIEKITKVGEHANNVCRRLKCILNRDPVVTSEKFNAILKSYGIIDFYMSDTQMAEYRVMIEKYLEVAERLLTCVTRLADAVKVK